MIKEINIKQFEELLKTRNIEAKEIIGLSVKIAKQSGFPKYFNHDDVIEEMIKQCLTEEVLEKGYNVYEAIYTDERTQKMVKYTFNIFL